MESQFQPYRALGYITSDVPFALQSRGDETFVTTAVGSSYHVYNCKKLNLVFVGRCNAAIDFVACQGHLTFTACQKAVSAWKRGKEVVHYPHPSAVTALLPFGNLLVTAAADNIVRIFNTVAGDVVSELEDLSSFKFTPSAVLHPSTYLNKILLGSREGKLQLWNIKTRKLIYEFKGWNSPVTVLAQAPAVDVVAIGLQDGTIVIHNLKYDETLMRFSQDGSPVTSLTFRTDEHPILATASNSGNITLWDLEKKELIAVMADCHAGSISNIRFLNSQPLLLSAGGDNQMKLWIFDNPDGVGRVLRSRSGHAAPPTKIRFHGSDGKTILSAAQDKSFRYVRIYSDEQSCEFSQGSLQKKAKVLGSRVEDLRLPAIIGISSCETRERHWNGITTAHFLSGTVHTWNVERKAIGKVTLTPPNLPDGCRATALSISTCGNFVHVGMSDGSIHKYNIQSGIHRGSYGKPRAHKISVSGVVSDSVNSTVLSAGKEGFIKTWSFADQKLKGRLELGSAVSQLEAHKEASLVAVVSQDYQVRVVDLSPKIVRTFAGHEGRVTDVTWSPDARLLVSSSMDATIRTWDILAGVALNAFAIAEPATSVAFSPVGDFLATTHVDHEGIYLWANKAHFGTAVEVRHSKDEQIQLLDLPETCGIRTEDQIDYLGTEVEDKDEENLSSVEKEKESGSGFKSVEQMDEHFITLSELPESRWANLSKLAAIRKRNKPIEPPSAPKAAPFFLTSTPGLTTTFKPQTDVLGQAMEHVSKRSRVLNFGKLSVQSQFQETLMACNETQNFDPLMALLESMGLSTIDIEFRSLSMANNGEQVRILLEFLLRELKKCTRFELVQAYLNLLLQVQGHVILENPDMIPVLSELFENQDKSWVQIQQLFQHSLCMVDFIKSGHRKF